MEPSAEPRPEAGPSTPTPILPRYRLKTVQQAHQLQAYETYHRSVTAHVQTLLHAAKGVGALLLPSPHTHARVALGQAGQGAPVPPPGPTRNGSGASSTDLSLVSSGLSSSQPSSSSVPTTTATTSTSATSATSASTGPPSAADSPVHPTTAPKPHHPPAAPRQPSQGFIFRRRGSVLSILSKDSPSTTPPPELTARPLEPIPIQAHRPQVPTQNHAGPSVPPPAVHLQIPAYSGKAPRHIKSLDDLSLLQNLSPPVDQHAKTREEEQKKAWDAEGRHIWRRRPSFELKLKPKSRGNSASSSARPDMPAESDTGAPSSSRPMSINVSQLGESMSMSMSASQLGTSQASSSLAPQLQSKAIQMSRSSSSHPHSTAPTSLRNPSDFGSEETDESYEARRLRKLRKHHEALVARVESWYVGVLAAVPHGQVQLAPEIPAFIPSPSVAKAAILTSPWVGEPDVGLAQLSLSASPGIRTGALGQVSPVLPIALPGTAHPAPAPYLGLGVARGSNPGPSPRATSVPPCTTAAEHKRRLPLDLELAVRLHAIEGLLGAPAPRAGAAEPFHADLLLGEGQTYRLGRGGPSRSSTVRDPDSTLKRQARH